MKFNMAFKKLNLNFMKCDETTALLEIQYHMNPCTQYDGVNQVKYS